MYESVYKNLLAELHKGKQAALVTYLDLEDKTKGAIFDKTILIGEQIWDNANNLKEDLHKTLLDSFEKGIPQSLTIEHKKVLIEPFFPKPRLIIFGGGHIANPLADFAYKVGFSTVLIDDRPFFANIGRFPQASEVICENFETVFDRLNLRKSDFIVIVTRGHRHDVICLRNALRYDTAYIGMIGSKRRVSGVKEIFLDEGFTKEELDNIYTPIGLPIKAVTPNEIAISIISEIIGVRRSSNNVFNLGSKQTFIWPEFDEDVVEEISNPSEIPRALITIISSKGSTPRKAGAKMILWQDGRTLGSIGGGCSEGEVLRVARDTIVDKGFAIDHVDMTGQVAEDEGMACGGIMDVLIEAF